MRNDGYPYFQWQSGLFNIGAGADYTTLTGDDGLFQAINNDIISGWITATIISDIDEPGTFALAKKDGYNLIIQPDATKRTLRGPYDGALIRMEGAANKEGMEKTRNKRA